MTSLLRTALAATALPLLATIGSAQALNRLQLNNGGDGLWNIQTPSATHTDPANGIIDGDSYFTALPARAARQCDGAMELAGFEYSVFDQDWIASEVLWGWAISETFVSTSGALRPDWVVDTVNPAANPPILTMPEFAPSILPFLGQPGGPGLANCPPPGYLTGYLIRDILVDSAGNGLGLTADGSTDYAFTHMFPSAQDSSMPSTNSCGGSGDATFSWLNSHDGLAAGEGENAPVGNLLAPVSEFNGYFAGGTGPINEANNGGNEVAWLIMDSPTVNPYVSINGSASTPELGTAALVLGLGYDGLLNPLPGFTSSLGAKMFDQDAEILDVALTFANISFSSFPGSFINGFDFCLTVGPGVELGLDPINLGFKPISSALSVMPFLTEPPFSAAGGLNHGREYGGQFFGDTVATSLQMPLSIAPAALVGTPLELQSFRFSANQVASASQVWLTEFQEGATIL